MISKPLPFDPIIHSIGSPAPILKLDDSWGAVDIIAMAAAATPGGTCCLVFMRVGSTFTKCRLRHFAPRFAFC